ncbi:MAG: S8 family serine peptidase [Oscillospiraceae bacterium]|nr:S8 family serine peptidase [Oscillospiraceae bacterium]
MKKMLLLLLVTVCALLTFASAEFDGYIVRVKGDMPMLFDETDSGMEYIAPNLYKVADEAAVEALRKSGLLLRARENTIIELFETTENEVVNTDKSWTDVVMKTDYASDLGLTGKGVRVAVIDSGVNLENDNLQKADIAPGYDYVTDSATTMIDDVGHGTNVIQMIVGDGIYKAVRGIAPEATIVPLRCFYVNEDGKKVAQTADLLAAMHDAVDKYDCDVINASWGFGTDFEDLREAVDHIEKAGAVLVTAVGNASTSQPQGTVIYPAAYENAVGIGSVDSTYTVASSSQKTVAVDACAPGVSVRFVKEIKDGKIYYLLSSGTSFAAPCVAGVAALIRQLQPEFSTASFRALIADRAIDLGAAGYDTSYGHGFVRVDKLLEKSWMFDEGGATGWLRNDGSTLVKATYEASGKMLSAGFTRAASAIEALTKSFTEDETAAFFLTGSDSKPLTAAIRTK